MKATIKLKRKQRSPIVQHIDDIVHPTPYTSVTLKEYIRKHRLGLGVFVLLFLAIAFGTVIVLNPSGDDNLKNVESVKARISRHYLLPTAEQPALATVTDKSKLSSAFAGKTENGDKILIYQKNHTAVVYRPSIDRVVDIEPVTIDTPASGVRN